MLLKLRYYLIFWGKNRYKLILLFSYPRCKGKKNFPFIGTTYQHIQKDFECTDMNV